MVKRCPHLRSTREHALRSFHIHSAVLQKPKHKTIDAKRRKFHRSGTQTIDLISAARLEAIALTQHYSQRQMDRLFNLRDQFERRRQSASPKISYNLEPAGSAFLSFDSVRD